MFSQDVSFISMVNMTFNSSESYYLYDGGTFINDTTDQTVFVTPLPSSPSGLNDLNPPELNVPYVSCEVLVAVVAVVGNALVILAFHKERRLRRRTNYYIVSLAAADLLVGLLGIPFAVLASIGLPDNLHACLFTVSLLVVLCTISIFCLVAVSVDRYWAILHPLGYSRNVSTRKAIGIIGACWVAGTIVGFLPLFGWHQDKRTNLKCFFTQVMDYNYLVFLYFFTIIFPALILAAFYMHIYRVVVKQLRKMERQSPGAGIPGGIRTIGGGDNMNREATANGGGVMLRVLGAARKREVKAMQNLSVIVVFFVLCWFPLYTINCIVAFCPMCQVPPPLTMFCIILSHLNSAGNPLLYAYHLKDFRSALRGLLLGSMAGGDSALDYHLGAIGIGTASRATTAISEQLAVITPKSQKRIGNSTKGPQPRYKYGCGDRKPTRPGSPSPRPSRSRSHFRAMSDFLFSNRLSQDSGQVNGKFSSNGKS